MEKYFPQATHILCRFHVIKAIDFRLNQKFEDKGLIESCKDDIREHFRNAMYAETPADLEIEKNYLLSQGNRTGFTNFEQD